MLVCCQSQILVYVHFFPYFFNVNFHVGQIILSFAYRIKLFVLFLCFFFHKQKFARSRLNLNISVDIIAFHVLSKIVIVVLLVLTVSVRFQQFFVQSHTWKRTCFAGTIYVQQFGASRTTEFFLFLSTAPSINPFRSHSTLSLVFRVCSDVHLGSARMEISTKLHTLFDWPGDAAPLAFKDGLGSPERILVTAK